MDHHQRQLVFSWVFDSLTYLLQEALGAAGLDDTVRGSAQNNLNRFRKAFDRRSLPKDEARFIQQWAPSYCSSVFDKALRVLKHLEAKFPSVAAATTRLNELVDNASGQNLPDGAATFDA